jgi:hypothetical protein
VYKSIEIRNDTLIFVKWGRFSLRKFNRVIEVLFNII